MGKLDCVNANIFHHTQKKIQMIIGTKLDRVNRPLDRSVEMEPLVIGWAKEEAKMPGIVRNIHVYC